MSQKMDWKVNRIVEMTMTRVSELKKVGCKSDYGDKVNQKWESESRDTSKRSEREML